MRENPNNIKMRLGIIILGLAGLFICLTSYDNPKVEKICPNAIEKYEEAEKEDLIFANRNVCQNICKKKCPGK